MSHLNHTILSTIQSLPEGGTLSPKEFLHLGSRAAVDQALSRLTHEGVLIRVRRGTYTAPVKGRFGSRPPSTAALVQQVEVQSGESIVPSTAASANALGLTTQVPVHEVFLTSGRSRALRLGNRTVQLKHAPHWQTFLGKHPAGQAVRALSWIGAEQAASALAGLSQKLPPTEWATLKAARAQLPGWMAQAIGVASDDA
jgi:hypothetical protein